MGRITLSALDDEVLDKVMRLFWQRGFLNTSIEDIAAETGLNRAALYKHFQGKDGLFLAMLKRYEKNITHHAITPLFKHQDGFKAIKDFFSQFSDPHKHSEIAFGCFLIATASELHFHHPNVKKYIHQFYKKLHSLFKKNLEQFLNEDSAMLSDMLADFLVGNVVGLMTLFRSGAPKKMIYNQVNGILKFISDLTTHQ